MDDVPIRKVLRLNDYDYSRSGCYFVTICVKGKQNILWHAPRVGANCVRPPLSNIGIIVENEIFTFSQIYENIAIDKYVVMPNHIHMLIIFDTKNGRSQIAPTLSRAIKQFKGSVTKQIGFSIWQKSFYDHIIRNESDYLEKRQYIDENPYRWTEDEYNC